MRTTFLHYSLFAVLFCLPVASHELFAQPKNKKGEKKKKEEKQKEPILKIDENNTPDPQLDAEAEASFIDGMKYYALEEYLRALDAFQKALALSTSKQSGIYYKIAETYFQLNNLPQAEFYAKNALEVEKTNQYYYLLLVKIHEKQLKNEDVAKDYENMLANTKGTHEYYYQLGVIYNVQNKLEKALDCYEKLEKIVGINERISKYRQTIYLKQNQPQKAIEEARKLLASAPFEARFVVNLAELLITQNQQEEAKNLVDKAFKEGATEPRLLLLLAKLERDKGNIAEAFKHLRRAFAEPDLEAQDKIEVLVSYMQGNELTNKPQEFADLAEIITQVHPEKARAYTLYADILLVKNDKLKARDNYLQAVKLENTKSDIWQRILGLDLEANQMENLAKHATQAVESFPNIAVFWYYQGLGFTGIRKYQDAINALEEGKRMAFNNPKLLEDINARLGDAYNGTKQYAESDAAYEAVLKNSPNNALVLNNYSYYLALRKQKLDYAKTLAERLVNNNPENANYLDTYGWVLYLTKDYQKARKQLEKAAQLSSNGTILEHYGDVLFQLGEKDLAVAQWQKAKKQGGTSAQIDKKIAEKKLVE